MPNDLKIMWDKPLRWSGGSTNYQAKELQKYFVIDVRDITGDKNWIIWMGHEFCNSFLNRTVHKNNMCEQSNGYAYLKYNKWHGLQTNIWNLVLEDAIIVTDRKSKITLNYKMLSEIHCGLKCVVKPLF